MPPGEAAEVTFCRRALRRRSPWGAHIVNLGLEVRNFVLHAESRGGEQLLAQETAYGIRTVDPAKALVPAVGCEVAEVYYLLQAYSTAPPPGHCRGAGPSNTRTALKSDGAALPRTPPTTNVTTS
eukprot:GFKZ01002389.1.p1 GENE.GFKZ01002389.1~~GFKZ01002389.1.p1  ORF type:complete len:125 (+),score=0.36 GFKZ01002389.1:457-831(+)